MINNKNTGYKYLSSLNNGHYIFTLFLSPEFSKRHALRICSYCQNDLDTADYAFVIYADIDANDPINNITSDSFYLCVSCIKKGIALEECIEMIEVKPNNMVKQ